MNDPMGGSGSTNSISASPAINPLVGAMQQGLAHDRRVMIFDRESGKWTSRHWSDIVAVAESRASRLVEDRTSSTVPAVGIIDEVSYDCLSTICAAWMAGYAISILPGLARVNAEASWLDRTKKQLKLIGATHVYASGQELQVMTQSSTPSLRVRDIATDRKPTAVSNFECALVDPNSSAVFQGTAGSTGEPKTVALTADALLHNLRAAHGRRQGDVENDVINSWLPLYHDMGLTLLLVAMTNGSEIWSAPTSAFARSPMEWLTWLTESKATVTAAPNFAYSLVARYANDHAAIDLSNLRTAINGAEPVDVSATMQFSRKLAAHGFRETAIACSYGLAEATCAVTMPHVDDGFSYDTAPVRGGTDLKFTKLGTAIDGIEVRIVPSEGDEFDIEREVGIVEFRGPSQMKGYVGDTPIPSHEWIGTGDLGYFVDGELVICGRKKELITISGRNLFPTEIERTAETVEGVRPGCVAAVGVADGPVGRSRLIVVAEYSGEDADHARDVVVSRVGDACGVTPSMVEFVAPGALPRTTSGKIRRLHVARRFKSEVDA